MTASPSALAISYPENLPVSARREEIMRLIEAHQVVVVAGETGSGKTTQLPKMCLELGRGIDGMIGHTQPRRIAARSVAERIAQELHSPIGEGLVGYQVRFTKAVGADTRLKLMTDGILLAELAHDRLLKRYDTIIIDEAHERSLNIDVVLGYLRRILPKRPDLKVIITSATIDVDRFARHFATPARTAEDRERAEIDRALAGDAALPEHLAPAPVIEVSGRTYPVEIRYRPLVLTPEDLGHEIDEDDDLEDLKSVERDETQAVLDAIDELAAEGPGDMLVFLPGEREIRDIADAVTSHLRHERHGIDVLQLFGRLSAADQHKIFEPKANSLRRRIVLATNIAETSLTVPGIRYVIDSGLARISRYSQRTKVQRLPIEPISQASANQRSGRCGRTADGIAIRLFSEADFDARPRFTEPEILRTSLAQVVLQMYALGLGDVAAFPFLEPPDQRAVADGIRLLEELGALEEHRGARNGQRLTEIGRQLARFPIEPRLARMILEADRRGALREVLVIVAGMTVPDVRERPLENPEKARELHRRFEDKDAKSDFLPYLVLWQYIRTQRKELSGSAFRKKLRAEYLHYVRIREWWDLHSQLKDMARDVGLVVRDSNPASPDRIHQSLLAGLLSHVGLYDERRREYQGGRGAKFTIWPGSSLKRAAPDYVMAAELVETSRLWGRTVARIDPRWAEELGAHVVKRSYSEPHWSSSRAGAMAHEKVMLYGVPIVADRVVPFGTVDPELSRDLFIRHALVEGDWRTRHHFFHDNRELLAEAEQLEHKTRRRDLVADETALVDFYDRRIPAGVVSGRHFDAWWKKQRHQTPGLLTFTPDVLRTDEAERVTARDFPDTWVQGDLTFPLTYAFAPGSETHATVARSRGNAFAADAGDRSAGDFSAGGRGPRTDGRSRGNAGRDVRGRSEPGRSARGGRSGRGGRGPATVRVRDGVTATIPLAVLNRVEPTGFDWLVPGLRQEKVTELIRSLPKALRRHLVPAPEKAKAVAAVLADEDPDAGEVFTEVVADELVALPGVPDLELYGPEFDLGKLPDHLRMHFRVVDDRGAVVGEGDDLVALQRELRGKVDEGIERAADTLTRTDLDDFPGREIPHTHTQQVAGLDVVGYPALVARAAEPGTVPIVDLKALSSRAEQAIAHPAGTVALLAKRVDVPTQRILGDLPNPTKLALAGSPYPSTTALLDDAIAAAVDDIVAREAPGGAWTSDEFERLERIARETVTETAERAVLTAARALAVHRKLTRELKRTSSIALLDTLTRIRDHAANLVRSGFIRVIGLEHLEDLPRYLEAALVRLEKAQQNPARDAQLEYQLNVALDRWEKVRSSLPAETLASPAAREIPFMLEEFRVSLFAQTIGAKYPVSDKRIAKAIAALDG